MNDLLLLLLLVAWFAIGVILGWFMGRRGHDTLAWIVTGVLLGPLAVLPALVQSFAPRTGPHVVRRARTRANDPRVPAQGVSVLVGVDGSPASRAALVEVERLFGGHLQRLTLVRVLPRDPSPAMRRQAVDGLEQEVDHTSIDVSALILHGDAATALRDHAASERYDVLAVGTRGSGVSRALLGSVASDLARGSPVPVLLVAPTDDRAIRNTHTASASN